MTKDRQIVLMLILRMRRAKALWKLHRSICDKYEAQLYYEYIEAANAAELARRILYKEE